MTPEQMKEQSSKKIKQIMDLMQVLHVKIEARQRISSQGFIESVVFWTDDEAYPQPESVPQEEAVTESDHVETTP